MKNRYNEDACYNTGRRTRNRANLDFMDDTAFYKSDSDDEVEKYKRKRRDSKSLSEMQRRIEISEFHDPTFHTNYYSERNAYQQSYNTEYDSRENVNSEYYEKDFYDNRQMPPLSNHEKAYGEFYQKKAQQNELYYNSNRDLHRYQDNDAYNQDLYVEEDLKEKKSFNQQYQRNPYQSYDTFDRDLDNEYLHRECRPRNSSVYDSNDFQHDISYQNARADFHSEDYLNFNTNNEYFEKLADVSENLYHNATAEKSYSEFYRNTFHFQTSSNNYNENYRNYEIPPNFNYCKRQDEYENDYCHQNFDFQSSLQNNSNLNHQNFNKNERPAYNLDCPFLDELRVCKSIDGLDNAVVDNSPYYRGNFNHGYHTEVPVQQIFRENNENFYENHGNYRNNLQTSEQDQASVNKMRMYVGAEEDDDQYGDQYDLHLSDLDVSNGLQTDMTFSSGQNVNRERQSTPDQSDGTTSSQSETSRHFDYSTSETPRTNEKSEEMTVGTIQNKIQNNKKDDIACFKRPLSRKPDNLKNLRNNGNLTYKPEWSGQQHIESQNDHFNRFTPPMHSSHYVSNDKDAEKRVGLFDFRHENSHRRPIRQKNPDNYLSQSFNVKLTVEKNEKIKNAQNRDFKSKNQSNIQSTDCFLLQNIRIHRTIGTGTFGRVFLVSYNNKFYALKRVGKAFLLRNKQMDNLMEEKAALSNLFYCKYFVRVIHTFMNKSAYFFLLEYIAGGELFFWLRKYGCFVLKDTRFYAAEIVLALEYLFSKNLIYRDLKPENILITKTGHIKLIDLGFAKETESLTFTLCGTAEYMAPEKLKCQGYDKASDIWTLGILIYEMLRGKPPFTAENELVLYKKIMDEEIKFERIDLMAQDLLEQLLEKNPSQRLVNIQKIKNHRFFNQIFDYIDDVQPPIIPKLESDGDSKYFARYEECDVEKAEEQQKNKKMFFEFE